MGNEISELSRIIREEIRLYSDLLEHERRKTALLTEGCMNGILESNRIGEGLNVKLQALEFEMLRLCRDLSKVFKIPREEFTLVKLTQHLEQSLALQLQSQIALVRDIVKQVISVNHRNRHLIENSVRYSSGILALISNARESYKPTGAFEPIPKVELKFSQSA
jgi:hypothetical protein